MAKTSQVPTFVRLGNVLTTTLLRAGVKLGGPGNSQRRGGPRFASRYQAQPLCSLLWRHRRLFT